MLQSSEKTYDRLTAPYTSMFQTLLKDVIFLSLYPSPNLHLFLSSLSPFQNTSGCTLTAGIAPRSQFPQTALDHRAPSGDHESFSWISSQKKKKCLSTPFTFHSPMKCRNRVGTEECTLGNTHPCSNVYEQRELGQITNSPVSLIFLAYKRKLFACMIFSREY